MRKTVKSILPVSLRTPARIALAAALAGAMTLSPAGAEIKLTEFNGKWIGSGTDRDSPIASPQRTRCHVTVKADLLHMSSETECDGQAGLHKLIRLSLIFDGNQFTGSAEQTSTVRASGEAAKVRAGPVFGSRTEDTASFEVRFPGFTPNAHVVLKLISPSSFSMQIASLGITLTNVTFRRPATP